MRIKLIILTVLLLFFGARPAFAVTVTTSNVPPSISDQPFTVDVSVNGAGAGTNYLRIDLYKDGTTNYFGETYNGANYYGGSDGKQYFPITILSGQTWSGSIQGKVGSPTATEFPGSGSYKLRVRRYTSSGNSSSGDTQTPQDINITLTSSSPSPSSSSSPLPSSSSSSTSSSSSSVFSISNVPSQIDSTEEFKVSVNLSLQNSPNATFYLKGAFKKADSSNYFGKTLVSGTWVKNGSTYSNQYSITTDSSGNWSGSLEIQSDVEDSGFTGTDNYVFKVGRYKSDGTGPTWSNETTIKIVSVTSSERDMPSIENVTSSTSNASGPTPSPAKITRQVSEKSIREPYYQIATVAAATASAISESTEVKSQKQTNYISWIGILMVFTGIGLFSYVYLRNKNLHEAVSNIFRKRN